MPTYNQPFVTDFFFSKADEFPAKTLQWQELSVFLRKSIVVILTCQPAVQKRDHQTAFIKVEEVFVN